MAITSILNSRQRIAATLHGAMQQMENTTQETPTPAKAPRQKRALKTNAPAKQAPARKPKVVDTERKPKAAAAPKVSKHLEAGVDPTGLPGGTPLINKNRKTAIELVSARDLSQMTDRHRLGLNQMREAYNGRKFDARGWNSGICRALIASGLLSHSGGQETVIDGKPYLTDGETPLMLQVTAKGLNYGKVPAK